MGKMQVIMVEIEYLLACGSSQNRWNYMHFPEGYIYAAGVDLVWEVCLDRNYLVHIKESLLNSLFE